MPNSTVDRLSSLPDLSRVALCRLWQALFKTDPPRGIQKALMLQFVGYRLQEIETGGLNNDASRRLREVADAVASSSNAAVSNRPAMKPGTRLIRQWKGQVYVVNVEEGTYEYRGVRYDSLSEIARLITGTRWSGPLFFGLKNRPSGRPEAR